MPLAQSENKESMSVRERDMKIVISNIALIAVCLIWGSGFSVVKETMNVVDPSLVVAMRFGIAAVLLGLFCLTRTKFFKPRAMLVGFLLAIPLYLAFYLQTVGLTGTTASNAGFITGMHVIFTPLLCFIFLKKKLSLYTVFGVLLATFGLGFMSLGENLAFSQGDMMVLGGALMFAVHMVLLSKYTLEYDGIWLSFSQIFWVAVIGFGVSFKHIPTIATFANNTFFSLFYLGAAGTAFAYLVQTVAQKYTSPTRTAIIFQTEAVFSAVFGYILLGEVMGVRQWIGAAMILAGILICEMWDLRDTRKASD